MLRLLVSILAVEDDKAVNEDLGTIDYLERKFKLLVDSGVSLINARILDEDDEHDTKAIELAYKIFEEE